MANKFVDTVLAGGNTGADWLTNPWSSIETAIEAANTAGDIIWHRRTSAFSNTNSDIAPSADGTLASPIRHMAWPRTSVAGTITFTNGQTVLIDSSVAGVYGRHMARFIKNNDADDGWYFITALIVKLPYDNLQTGRTFSVGQTITGVTSGTKGKIHYISGTTLYVVTYAATGLPALFTDNENINVGAVYYADVNQVAGGIYDGFLIDREYAGTTAAGANFEIKEDEDYDDRPGVYSASLTFNDNGANPDTITGGTFDVTVFCVNSTITVTGTANNNSTFTITAITTSVLSVATASFVAEGPVSCTLTSNLKATWDADDHNLPVIDFGANAYQLLYNTATHNILKCFDLRGSTDTAGLLYIAACFEMEVVGCLFSHDANTRIVAAYESTVVTWRQCVVVGNGAGTSQKGVQNTYGGKVSLIDCAIYNAGDNGLWSPEASVRLDNVNIGTALNNVDNDIGLQYQDCVGRDVRLGGVNGLVVLLGTSRIKASFENYGKVLGAHRTWFNNGQILSNDCSVDPNQRSGGASKVIEIDCTGGSAANAGIDEWAEVVFEHEFEQTAGSKTYRYYVQNTAAINSSDGKNAADIWLEGEFVEKYDDTSEYVMGRHADGHLPVRSTSSANPIPARADANDWAEYIQITMNAATASKVRIRGKVSWFETGKKIYIDPKVVIS